MEKPYQQYDLWLIMVFTALLCTHGDAADTRKPCTNSKGELIPSGKDFMPDHSDPCTECYCDNGYPVRCKTSACSPPPNCLLNKPIPGQCCQFDCEDVALPPFVDVNTTLDGTDAAEDDNITNLSLRLVASTVTSFLVLALLLFMVHRLRQRRLMMAMRRFEAQARQQRGDEDDMDHYIPAAFLHIECPPMRTLLLHTRPQTPAHSA